MAALESVRSHHKVAPREALAARLPAGEVGGELLCLLERLKTLDRHDLARLVTERHLIRGDGLQVDAILRDYRHLLRRSGLTLVEPAASEEAHRQTRRGRDRIPRGAEEAIRPPLPRYAGPNPRYQRVDG